MTFRGKISCSECGVGLNESKEPVLEHEKAWCERQAIYMCQPNCEHAKAEIEAKGLCLSINVTWGPWESAA